MREAIAAIDLKETNLKETVEAATNEILLSKTDTVQLLKSAGEDINLKIEKKLDSIEKTGSDIINDIELKAEKVRDQIKADADAKAEDCITFIRKRKSSACDEIENVKKTAMERITDTAETVSKNLETAVASTSQRIVEMEEQVTDTKKEILEELQHSKLTYVQSKEAFRRRLIEMYIENVVNISPILLQPERCDVRIDQVYIDPLIKIIPKDKNKKYERIQSYQQILRKDGKQQKSIYLIGEAGSGKSTFCINMINNWCEAHSDNEAEETMNIQEMKRYQFLFYLPLRHEDTYDHVEEMILSHYDDPVIITIFEQEPECCLILLDGLDEWILKTEPKTSLFQSKGLPRRNLSKGYTIITTSRPWKFESIGLKNAEIQIKLQLCGVDNQKTMIEKTIGALNEMFHTKKNTYGFQNCLLNSKIDNEMKSVPIILQQLICLWFDNKLSCLGKSDIYSQMLGMFFEWTDLRTGNEDVLSGLRDKLSNIDIIYIPDQFNYRELCPELKFVIKNIAHLAYATLLTTRKESSLIFDDSTFKNLNIHNEVIVYSLKTGIISKQRAVGLSLSRRQLLSFSFVHKSMQEFLCALHIFIEFKRSAPKLFKPFLLSTIDKNLECFKKYFEDCKTTIDILDLSNVFMFLCGFDTYLAVYISKFVYNIVLKDQAIINYRTSISYWPFEPDKRSFLTTVECLEGHQEYALDIQNILFSFIKEANMHDEKPGRLFFLSDFVYLPLYTVDVESIKYVNPDLIISLNIDISGSPLPRLIFEFLKDPFLSTKMSTLKLRVSSPSVYDLQLDTTLQCIIKRSRSFLTCLSFKGNGATNMYFPTSMRSVTKLLISVLPNMNKLEAIKLENIRLTFPEKIKLSKWLSSAKYLRQISLRKISDNPDGTLFYPDSHNIDLSQHRELQVLDYDFNTIAMTEFSVQNLETCYFYLRSNFISESVCTVLKRSKKLKCLYLTGKWLYLHKEKVTKIIQNLLSNLIDLKQLHLEKFCFSENILVDPMKMQNLREITLKEINMSAGSWNCLLESVLRLPQNVNVCIQYSSEQSLYIIQERKDHLHNLKSGYSYVIFSTKP
ncbi:uncharacterized protein LOC132751368 [Ruditapes philippinarum]|uniref:uncharacterized protein LOC132751368 n=1 Tax=Ruditapes philippinarum TaxID=129788 RepID=UPI00295BE844|nr:uncharacterized protein LOC132751368 [Ruditapes philippinarum]